MLKKWFAAICALVILTASSAVAQENTMDALLASMADAAKVSVIFHLWVADGKRKSIRAQADG